MELIKRQNTADEYKKFFGIDQQQQKELEFEPVFMDFVYNFLDEKKNESSSPIDMTFMSGFSGSYNLAAKKNLRCFPNCCKQGHLEKSFCGTNIEICVTMLQQGVDVEKCSLIGEFTTAERGPSLSFGQDIDEQHSGSFLKGSFSHYTPNTPNFAVFTIRPPRKWQLTARSCKVKMYILVVYLILDNKRVQSVLISPTFEVKCRKQKRKLRANSASTTTSTTSTFSSCSTETILAKENCTNHHHNDDDMKMMLSQHRMSSEDDDDEEEKCTTSNEEVENHDYQDHDSHHYHDDDDDDCHFHDPTFDDDIVRFLEFSDDIGQ